MIVICQLVDCRRSGNLTVFYTTVAPLGHIAEVQKNKGEQISASANLGMAEGKEQSVNFISVQLSVNDPYAHCWSENQICCKCDNSEYFMCKGDNKSKLWKL